MNLDLAPEKLRELLYSVSDMAVRLYTGVEKKKVFHGKSPAEVRALFDELLPAQPTDLHDLLEKVERDVFGASTLNISPHFYGYVLRRESGRPAGRNPEHGFESKLHHVAAVRFQRRDGTARGALDCRIHRLPG